MTAQGRQLDGITVRAEFFPGTTEPVPPLLTPLEAVRLLRLDLRTLPDGTEEIREPADALKSLDHLCRQGRLTPIRIGKCRRFARAELLRLIEERGPAG
ncbi:MAG: helix-turn-helix domain-containing protein [Planctomycetota bacterium]|nr:helix-turn-helix domain-containing protein [Planctomycetota bacterium]